ncbi:MAG: hypothetical protein DRJ51_04070 [Thermoprotei archaeon]|nr:MAG: hypothetical protein DRJ51_04070 [Thermoprotei archaeon]
MDSDEHSQRRNYLALLTRRTLAGFFNGLPSQYMNIYVLEMGFTEQDLGALRSVGTLFATLPSAVLNFMADVANRRKAYLVGLLFEILSALFFFIDGGALPVLAAMMFFLVSFFGLSRVEDVLVADSLRSKRRAFGFSVIRSLSIFVSLIAPIAAAHLVSMFGGISVEGIRPVFLIQLLGLIVAFIIALLYVKDVRIVPEVGVTEAIKNSISIVRLNPWLERWILLEVLGGYVFSMSTPFETIYAVKVKGADEFILGYMGFALNVGSLIALPLVGRLADSIGRVKTILLLRPLYYISIALLIMAPSPSYLIVAWLIRGVWFASIAPFQALAIELVPFDYRGRWNGIRTLISLPLRSPGSVIGGYLYMNVSPETPFIAAVLVDLLLRVPLIYMTPETLNRKKYLEVFRRI